MAKQNSSFIILVAKFSIGVGGTQGLGEAGFSCQYFNWACIANVTSCLLYVHQTCIVVHHRRRRERKDSAQMQRCKSAYRLLVSLEAGPAEESLEKHLSLVIFHDDF